jgi:hypothetical protein
MPPQLLPPTRNLLRLERGEASIGGSGDVEY